MVVGCHFAVGGAEERRTPRHSDEGFNRNSENNMWMGRIASRPCQALAVLSSMCRVLSPTLGSGIRAYIVRVGPPTPRVFPGDARRRICYALARSCSILHMTIGIVEVGSLANPCMYRILPSQPRRRPHSTSHEYGQTQKPIGCPWYVEILGVAPWR